MKKKIYTYQLIAFFLLLSNLCPLELNAQNDTIYVEDEKTDFTIGLSTRYRQYSVDLLEGNVNYWSVNKNDISIGIRARYKWLNLAIIYAVKDLYRQQAFTPDLVNVDIKLYPKNFFIKSNIQYTSLIRSVPNLLSHLSEFQSDSKLVSINLWGAYIFNSDQLSMSSSYSFVDRQKKTAGSWLISSFLEEHRLYINPMDYSTIGISEELQFRSLSKTRLGIGFGYTQSIVWNNFVWNGIISGGIEVARIRSEFTIPKELKSYLDLAPNLRMNTSLVYHQKDHYLAIIGEYYPDILANSKDIDLEKNHWWIRFSYGYKF